LRAAIRVGQSFSLKCAETAVRRRLAATAWQLGPSRSLIPVRDGSDNGSSANEQKVVYPYYPHPLRRPVRKQRQRRARLGGRPVVNKLALLAAAIGAALAAPCWGADADSRLVPR